MADVRTQFRAVDVFAVFAQARRPLRLVELAQEMGLAPSSCFTIVRGLLESGYLYEVAPRRGYYPSGKMVDHAATIAVHDPVIEHIGPILQVLRDETQETVAVGKESGMRCQYIFTLGPVNTNCHHDAK